MNSYPYIPPPFPFPERWNDVFSSSPSTSWLTPKSIFFYPPNINTCNERQEKSNPPIQPETTINETELEPVYRIEVSEDWLDFVERSYKRIEERKKNRRKRYNC